MLNLNEINYLFKVYNSPTPETMYNLIQNINNYITSLDLTIIIPQVSAEESYKSDFIHFFPHYLNNVDLDSLIDYKRSEVIKSIIQSTIQLPDNQSIKIYAPSSDNSKLSSLCFSITNTGQDNLYNLQNFWPKQGALLPIKPLEGFKIRQELALELSQNINYVTSFSKALPPTPQESFDLIHSLPSLSSVAVPSSETVNNILAEHSSITQYNLSRLEEGSAANLNKSPTPSSLNIYNSPRIIDYLHPRGSIWLNLNKPLPPIPFNEPEYPNPVVLSTSYDINNNSILDTPISRNVSGTSINNPNITYIYPRTEVLPAYGDISNSTTIETSNSTITESVVSSSPSPIYNDNLRISRLMCLSTPTGTESSLLNRSDILDTNWESTRPLVINRRRILLPEID